MKLEVKRIGNSAGFILPREVMQKYGFSIGDELFVKPDGQGGLNLSTFNPEFDEAMKVARDVMEEYKDTFRELAK